MMKLKVGLTEIFSTLFEFAWNPRFLLSWSSLSERQEWVDAVQKAITDHTSRQLSFQNTKTTSSLKNEDSSEPFKLGQQVSAEVSKIILHMTVDFIPHL